MEFVTFRAKKKNGGSCSQPPPPVATCHVVPVALDTHTHTLLENHTTDVHDYKWERTAAADR